MQYAPTRIHEKFGRFHIPPPEYAKNAPHFIIPNKDSPQNLPGFRPKSSSRIISGRMLLRPTRVRAKPARFHISTHVPTKNPPDFTHPNKDIPKTGPILDLNLRRGVFRGVCNTPLHGYMKNLAGFIFPHTTWRETRRVFHIATRLSETRRVLLTPKSKSTLPRGGNRTPHRIERRPRLLFSPPHSADPKNTPPNRPRQALEGEKGRGFLPTFAPQNQTNRPGNPPLNRAHSGPLF